MIRQTVRGVRGCIVPLGILTFTALLLLALYELFAGTAAAWLFGVMYLCVVLWISFYCILTVEYVASGNAFVLRRLVCGKIVRTETIPFAQVTAIGYGERLRIKGKQLRCTDFCATLRGRHLAYMMVFYKSADGERMLKCEPNDAFCTVLRKHTAGKFYEKEQNL